MPREARVVVLPRGEVGGPGGALLRSEGLNRLIGSKPAADGAFEVKHVADGGARVVVRVGEDVVAEREIVVAGNVDVGEWPIE